jgi:ABC-type glycerol-3-phosphate transport system substrate-binding protein
LTVRKVKAGCLLAIVLLIVMLAGAISTGKTVEITLFGMPHANNPEWNEAGVEMWKEMYPQYQDVRVSIISEGSAKLVTMVAAGTPPDIIHASSSTIPSYVYNGFLQDISPLIQKDRDFNIGSYIPSTIDTLRYKQGLYGLPRAWSAVATMYNADLLEVRGIATPDPDWTWDDLIVLTKKATFDSDGDGHVDYFGFSDTWTHHHRWPTWVWGAGGDLYSPDMRTATLNSENAIRGFEFMTDLYITHNVAPKVVGGQLAEPGITSTQSGHNIHSDLFNRGRIAFFNTTRFSRPVTDLFRFGVLLLPKGPVSRTSVMVADYYGITPFCEEIDTVWHLVKTLTSPAGYEVARDPSKMYYWALSPHTKQARDTLLAPDVPDIQAINWVIVAEDARRAETNHPAAGSFTIDFNAIINTTMSVRQALNVAVEQQNARLAELWAKKPW